MKKQRQSVDGFSPDQSLIDDYVHLARLSPSVGDILDDYAADARQCVMVLYKDQRAQVEAGERRSIDERILKFVREQIRSCAEDSDPLGAIQAFVGPPLRRGRPRRPYRDLAISADVAERVVGGNSVDDACHVTSRKRNLSFEQVRRIYFEQRKRNPIAIWIEVHGRGVADNSP
jgi:hypothetical protein